MSTTYTVTHTFVADTTAVASEVNQNFTDVLSALNALDASNLSSNTVPLARIAGLTTTQFAANVIDTDDTLAADSDTRIASQSATKTFVTNRTTMAPAISGAGTGFSGGETVTLANGFIIKAGKDRTASNTVTVTFGSAFPNALIAISAIAESNSPGGAAMSYGSESTSSVVFFSEDTADDFYWIAIGW